MVKVFNSYDKFQGRRVRDRMVVRFTATCAISAYHVTLLTCHKQGCLSFTVEKIFNTVSIKLGKNLLKERGRKLLLFKGQKPHSV
jgi:hypothetical protein